jgi:hypothetical protein
MSLNWQDTLKAYLTSVASKRKNKEPFILHDFGYRGPKNEGIVFFEDIDNQNDHDIMEAIRSILGDHKPETIVLDSIWNVEHFVCEVMSHWSLTENQLPTMFDISAEPHCMVATPPALEHSIMSRQYEIYAIDEHEKEIVEDALLKHNVGSIDAFLALPDSYFEGKFFANHMRIVLKGRKRAVPKVCDCGARHTSFPNHHLHWCSVKA